MLSSLEARPSTVTYVVNGEVAEDGELHRNTQHSAVLSIYCTILFQPCLSALQMVEKHAQPDRKGTSRRNAQDPARPWSPRLCSPGAVCDVITASLDPRHGGGDMTGDNTGCEHIERTRRNELLELGGGVLKELRWQTGRDCRWTILLPAGAGVRLFIRGLS